ncbi:Hypothetical protein OINT_2000507 [Brucella intermedia LMG 3301]|uniref:Uncharacterized protein n=1 Tax=Brucella intermedia LMG 3301 TaxID=641118 RepID=C4WNN2_9HYPH|nr:Hypothetical protein OINT_2000507 [Brucella intermedia LMG 3301]
MEKDFSVPASGYGFAFLFESGKGRILFHPQENSLQLQRFFAEASLSSA